MGVDCSMILRDDRLRNLHNPEERMAIVRAIQDLLVKKYGIANRDEEVIDFDSDGDDDKEYEEDFPSFSFEPYGVAGINMYDGFWEIESTYHYAQYFDSEGGPSDLQEDFFDIAQDFGCDEAHICDEFCTWNGGELETLNFDEWLDEMRSRFGEIKEIKADTKFDIDYKKCPGVFHESFSSCKEKMERLAERVAAKGYSHKGIHKIGWNHITVMKDDKLYVMNKHTLELQMPNPVESWCDLNTFAFEVVSNGKVQLFSCNGERIFETKKGHFLWERANQDGWGPHAIRIFNRDSGQEVFMVNTLIPSDNPNDLLLFRTYYDRNNNVIIPMAQV